MVNNSDYISDICKFLKKNNINISYFSDLTDYTNSNYDIIYILYSGNYNLKIMQNYTNKKYSNVSLSYNNKDIKGYENIINELKIIYNIA